MSIVGKRFKTKDGDIVTVLDKVSTDIKRDDGIYVTADKYMIVNDRGAVSLMFPSYLAFLEEDKPVKKSRVSQED